MGRTYQYNPYIRYNPDMPKMQFLLMSLNYDWEDDIAVNSNSMSFKENFAKINKSIRQICFVCSKRKTKVNKLMFYKEVFNFNSYLERKLLDFEPKWLPLFKFIRLDLYRIHFDLFIFSEMMQTKRPIN